MAESRGIDIIRSNDGSILFRVSAFDAANAKITTGTLSMRLWRVIPTSGSLETYDFDDDTFKTGAVTTAEANLTHQQAENSTYDTGIWTRRHTVLTDFTIGDKYIAEFSHASLPKPIPFEFQYGDLEGDLALALPLLRERNTAQAGAAGSITLDTGASSVNEFYTGHIVAIVAGTGSGQARIISAYVGSTRVATVKRNWVTAPDNTSEFIVIPLDSDSIVDEVWDEDASTHAPVTAAAGNLLNILGGAIASRSFNATLHALLGVPDTAVTDTVAGQVWEETRAGHNTVGSMGETMNDLAASGSPTAAAIADAVWDENIVAAHGTASTAGLLLRVLGGSISTRANNATLNALLGVPDSAGATIAETIWDEDITTHLVASTSGLALSVLGSAIAARSNNANLNALLGVTDSSGVNLSDMVWDEVLDGSHTVSDSAAERLKAIDDLTQSGGAGDLADTRTQVRKIDQTAASGSPAADSVVDKIDSITTTVSTLDRDLLVSLNLEGTVLHIEVAIEQFGVIQTSPWVDCAAQVYDEDNNLLHNIGTSDFGAIGPRGVFQFDQTGHSIQAGKTYQIAVQVTDGALLSISTTKIFKNIQG